MSLYIALREVLDPFELFMRKLETTYLRQNVGCPIDFGYFYSKLKLNSWLL